MSLEGNLRDFNILEIIQLLGQQGKSGILRSWKEGEEKVEVYFFEGKVVHAVPSPKSKIDPIGEKLVKAGFLSKEGLKRVLEEQKKAPRPLGEIIVSEGLVSEEVVRETLCNQVYEIIYDLFHWQEGQFRFEALPVKISGKVSFFLDVEEIMLNILRMVDESSQIEKKIPTKYLILKSTGMLEREGKELPWDRKMIYELVDGKRSVHEIINNSLFGQFFTLEIISELLEKGYIKPVGIKREIFLPSPSVLGEKRPRREGWGRAAIIGGFCLILFFLSFGFFNFRFLGRGMVQGLTAPPSSLSRFKEERLKWAKRIYFLEVGKEPSADELVKAGLLSREEVK